ncbi:hypothetical protein GJV76_10490 [Myroides sp. BIT-d1]|uniref:Uncharacterized protein n=1 Tax=Myroides albus TaxID=2562892 RepID=A0A6I3LLI6_9FLAO|nr:hypothetical protein [Myroides albus]MTG98547.1 hypothetical protein [Myroides albus]
MFEFFLGLYWLCYYLTFSIARLIFFNNSKKDYYDIIGQSRSEINYEKLENNNLKTKNIDTLLKGEDHKSAKEIAKRLD